MRLVLTALISLALAVPTWAQSEKAAAARDAIQRRSFEEAVGIIGEPGSPEERYWLGRALVELNRTDEAEAQFRQMTEEAGESSQSLEGLARVAVARRSFDEALEQANRAVEMDGERADAHYVKGLVLANRQDFANAAASLERAIALDPNNGYAYYQLGLVHYRQRRPDQTIRNFQKFVELMPNAPEAPQVQSILRTLR